MMGMSCVGKSTMASLLTSERGHRGRSFDGQFRYDCATLAGYDHSGQRKRILEGCGEPPWVLDNWTTEDVLGAALRAHAPDAAIFLLYDTHAGILDRYRVPVVGPDAHYGMYERMYRRTEFERYGVPVRPFRAAGGDYRETTVAEFRGFVAAHGARDAGRTFVPETWRWR